MNQNKKQCSINTDSRSAVTYSVMIWLFALSSCSNKSSNDKPVYTSHGIPQEYIICNTPQIYADKIIGDGHCVTLIKECASAPMTSEWRAGEKVLDHQDQLPLGTIIATFKNDRYPNRAGYHAAIYISHDQSGIWVWDQWRGKAVHRRLIRVRNDNATASNSAQAYSVVKLTN